MGRCGGGLFTGVGGWKTGAALLLSNACLGLALMITSPNTLNGWVGADDGSFQLTCGLWRCLRLTRVPQIDGGYTERGTWESSKISEEFDSCGDLKQHVKGFQALACILLATVAVSWLHLTLNLFTDSARFLRRWAFIFHFVDSVVALVAFSVMAGAYRQDLCDTPGQARALKDYRVGEERLVLGVQVFGATVLVFCFSGLAGALCLSGALQDDSAGAVYAAPQNSSKQDFDSAEH
eukprot:TRINITY_DN51172_c0_g1_i1.p2 TRINITY_DN51172_c0_g1~~TRINITY_DN51172_c0_g1_i1.p2  ORF type:complete len:236 (+),score=69.84 TRINITY_DN51172_c0_g1_i1:81-788(+)